MNPTVNQSKRTVEMNTVPKNCQRGKLNRSPTSNCLQINNKKKIIRILKGGNYDDVGFLSYRDQRKAPHVNQRQSSHILQYT